MAAVPTSRLYTADEAKALPDEVGYELIDGELEERGMGAKAAWVGARALRLLGEYADSSGLFWAFDSSLALHLFPQRERYFRRGDAVLVRRDRFDGGELPVGDVYFAPDVVVEALSPSDKIYATEAKLADYLAAGVRMIWFVHPETRSLMLYRPNEHPLRLTGDDPIPGFDVLPGFERRVSDLFPA
jgi:Uma2 family endonuclease